jgi:hypothetical protein
MAYRYVVSVIHNGGHGPEDQVPMVTDDLVKVVDLAKDIRSHGFTVGNEGVASVFKLEEDVIYTRRDFKDESARGSPLVFWAGFPYNSRKWTERWWDTALQQEYEAKKKAAAEVVPDEEDLRDSRDVHTHPNSPPTT